MKRYSINGKSSSRLLLAALLTSLSLTAAAKMESIYSFVEKVGHEPDGLLIEGADGYLYGTVAQSGLYNAGAVFKMSKTGSLSAIASFKGTDGSTPYGRLVLAPDGNLYGTTYEGGVSGNGTVFRLTPDGQLQTVVSFVNSTSGAHPRAGLTVGSDGALYGSTENGGAHSYGKLFRLTTDGAFSTVLDCDGVICAYPSSELTLGKDGALYGVSCEGGKDLFYGSIYRISATGAVKLMHGFDSKHSHCPSGPLTEMPDGSLYGAAKDQGYSTSGGYGSIFRISERTGSFVNVYKFTGEAADSAYPTGQLALGGDGNLYGFTSKIMKVNGVTRFGTYFQLSPKGVLKTFADLPFIPGTGLMAGSDGKFYTGVPGPDFYTRVGFVLSADSAGNLSYVGTVSSAPEGDLPSSGLGEMNGEFYGVTYYGGALRGGVLYKIDSSGHEVKLRDFDCAVGCGSYATPLAGPDQKLYGTFAYGGTEGLGAVYRAGADGTVDVIASFTSATGYRPWTSLVAGVDGAYYGTTNSGGDYGRGTFYKVTSSGELTKLASFDSTTGYSLYGDLVLAPDGNFYGVALRGGANGYGTIYRVTPTGQITALASLSLSLTGYSDSKLTVGEDGNLYGTFTFGGSNASGVLYRVTLSGDITVLVEFDAVQGVGTLPSNFLTPAPGGGFYGMTITDVPSIYHVDLTGNVKFMSYLPGFTADVGYGRSLTPTQNGSYYGVTSGGGSSGIGNLFHWTP